MSVYQRIGQERRPRELTARRRLPWMLLIAPLALLGFVQAFADDTARPDFEGTWLSDLIIFDDPRWRIEDILCQYCTVEAFEYAQNLLADPANDDRSIDEISQDVRRFNLAHYISLQTAQGQKQYAEFDPADDPVNDCVPVGLIRQILQPLPMVVEQFDDRVQFTFEYEDTVRTVHMDGRGHPADLTPSRLGHAIGWYDEDTLVVETRGIEPAVYAHIVGKGFINTSNVVTIERYRKSADGERLDMELTVVDPYLLRKPLAIYYNWLSIPDQELQEYVCEAVSGEL